jgi:two-component system, chemotaxis family, chemotaxis protein CheY
MSKAMVVDDSRAMRLLLSRALAESGFSVIQASDGKEGLDTLRRERDAIRLVLVDWNMPNMNGLEFVTNVRADRDFSSVRLMMVTTETEIEQMARALEAGADEYIMKPFTPEAIHDKLRLLGVLE